MSQKILRGLESIKSVIEGKKFLLVRDEAYDHLKIKEFFDVIPHLEFSEITPNPLYEQVCKGIELFNREQCELIVAVGGGSTIDVAKCIKLYCKMDSSINFLKQKAFDSGVQLIAIPTTAGTGSESTQHAVIYYDGVKQSVSHKSIVPDFAVLEPSVLETLPVYQKKCTMLDALCQAIESFWSVNSTDESKKYSQKAIIAIKENWIGYIFENMPEANEKIMEAANLAGRAINITATTAPHAMSYKLTSLYGIPHGHAVAVCLPEVWEYISEHIDDCTDIRGEQYLKDTMAQLAKIIDIDFYKEMMKKMEIISPCTNDKENDLDILTQAVNPVRLKNNPVALDAEVLKGMYRRILR